MSAPAESQAILAVVRALVETMDPALAHRAFAAAGLKVAPRDAPDAARAFEIADHAKFVDLNGYGDFDVTLDGTCFRFPRAGHYGDAEMRSAAEWLQLRGYVQAGRDARGEYVKLLRKPDPQTP